MQISVTWPYKRYSVDVAMQNIEQQDGHTLDELIVHEFIHVLLEPLSERFDNEKKMERDLVESVTTAVQIALLNAAVSR